MTPKELQARFNNLTALPKSEWEDFVTDLDISDRQELEKYANTLCQKAAYMVGYLSVRGTNGCGDHGHEDGEKGGKEQLKAVRKALGYTLP